MPAAPTGSKSIPHAPSSAAPRRVGPALLLGALGVVFGDVGTSPLYAIKECFGPANPHHVAATPANVLGVLSLVTWSLVLVICVKYLAFIVRADNDGAGGILALLALIPRALDRGRGILVPLALVGTALLYGDGVITPAISVLSAVEGLEVATGAFERFTVPITCGILVALFAIQRRGTGGLGRLFGPITLLWFVMIAALGVPALLRRPDVLRALDPRHGVAFFAENGLDGFLVLGAVFLVVTGGEALYADMGHFGRAAVRRTWFAVVFPALLLNYFGQGANLLDHPAAAANPFYALVPAWALYPAVAVATAAAIVASQALISGVFSLTQQAVQLGFFPRVTIVHTSRDEEQQIFVPEMNAMLLVACIGCVLLFRSSSALAAAYGIAVTGTMAVTTVLFFAVAHRAWNWPLRFAAPLALAFLAFDLAFLAANAAKLRHGGWFPLVLAAVLLLVMTTWRRGRELLGNAIRPTLLPLDVFLEDARRTRPQRVEGTAVFMASNPEGTPAALLHNFKHNRVVHHQVVLLSIEGAPVPEAAERLSVEDLGDGWWRVRGRYGFMEWPDVPALLRRCAARGLDIDPMQASYYVGRETLVPTGAAKMARWRKSLFAFISRNARPATSWFNLPPNRVVELGMQIRF